MAYISLVLPVSHRYSLQEDDDEWEDDEELNDLNEWEEDEDIDEEDEDWDEE